MKYLSSNTKGILAALIFYLACPAAAYAAAGEGHVMTIPQLLMLALVMGWYLYNHFKDKIKALFTKKNDQ